MLKFIKRFLRNTTGCKAWKFTEGPDSGVGTDYYLKSKDRDEAYVNVDQDYVTITLNGDVVFAGEVIKGKPVNAD